MTIAKAGPFRSHISYSYLQPIGITLFTKPSRQQVAVSVISENATPPIVPLIFRV